MKLLNTKSLLKKIKKRLYIILIRPVILYGLETWVERKFDKNKFLILERKILPKIFGLLKDNVTGEWIRRKKTKN